MFKLALESAWENQMIKKRGILNCFYDKKTIQKRLRVDYHETTKMP